MIQKKLLPLLFLVLVGMLFTACQPIASQLENKIEPIDAPTEQPNPTATEKVEETPIVIFAAGSLIIPFAAVEEAFEAKYPQYDARIEYHGSIQAVSYTHL